MLTWPLCLSCIATSLCAGRWLAWMSLPLYRIRLLPLWSGPCVAIHCRSAELLAGFVRVFGPTGIDVITLQRHWIRQDPVQGNCGRNEIGALQLKRADSSRGTILSSSSWFMLWFVTYFVLCRILYNRLRGVNNAHVMMPCFRHEADCPSRKVTAG